jgi:hypothetical protein
MGTETKWTLIEQNLWNHIDSFINSREAIPKDVNNIMPEEKQAIID